MTRPSATNDRVKTVDTAFDVIESLREPERATLGELADRLGVAKSTVHRHLVTLHDRGYSVDDQGHIQGLRAIGPPVHGPDDASSVR